MQLIRTLSLGVATLAFSVVAIAQFDGPAPLAWRWMLSTGTASGAPAVDGTTVYVAAGQRIYALDKDSGNQRWKYPNVDPITGNFKGKPILTQGLVIAAASNSTIYAVDTSTHEAKWSYVAPAPIIGDIVLADKTIVAKLSDSSLVAIDAATGKPIWKDPLKFLTGLVGQIAAYHDTVVVLTDDNQILSIGMTNPQKPNWHQKFTSLAPDATPLVFGDYVYVASGPFLNALNANSGSARWQTNLGEDIAFAPSPTGAGMMVVTSERHAYMVDIGGKRNQKFQVDLGSEAQAAPTPVGPDMYIVPTANGGINLINSKTGESVWTYVIRPVGELFMESGGTTGGRNAGLGSGATAQNNAVRILSIAAAGPAVVDGNTLLILARDGSLLAFDKDHGVDLTPPSVQMTWPSPGDVVSGQPPLVLAFKIEDEASGINLNTLKIDIDGLPMEYTFSKDGLVVVQISQSGRNHSLSDGRRNVHVAVSDWLGNAANANFALSIDNTLRPMQPPAIDTTGKPGGPGGVGPKGGGTGGGAGG